MRKNKQSNRLYTTSEICDMYGLSASGLRFLEEKGLISPEREFGSRYRVFTLTECSRLFQCQILRQYGFNLSDSIQLLQNGSPQDFHRHLKGRKAEIEAEIAQKQALLASLELAAETFSHLDKAPSPRLVTVPAMLRNCLDSATPSDTGNETFRRWYAALPFTAASLYIRRESLYTHPLDFSIGFIIEADKAPQYDLYPDSRTTLLPSRPCLHTIIHFNDMLENVAESLRPALDALSSMGLTLSGDPFTRMLGFADQGSGMMRFDEIWFPVANTDKYSTTTI